MSMLIGIDVGSTVLKAAAFDARTGRLLGQDSLRLETHTDASGRREQSPAQLRAAMRACVRAAVRKSGQSSSSVEGVGLASQGGSMIIADRESGRALTPMALWNDAKEQLR